MTPDKLIGVKVRCIAGQKVETQLALSRCNVVTNEHALVGRQSVENDIDRFLPVTHQFPQQLDKQLAVEPAFVGTEPELSTRTDRRSSRDRLPLPRPMNNRCLSTSSPGLTMYRVSSKTGLIPKQNRCSTALGLAGQRGIRFLLPPRDCFWVTLVGPLQWLLWSQLQFRQQRANGCYSEGYAKFLFNQYRHDRAGPQTEVKTVLPWISTVDPTEHLSLLCGSQTARAPCSSRRAQGSKAASAPSGQLHPLVDGRAAEPVRGNHRGWVFAFTHTLDRHQPNLFECRVIERAAVKFHAALYHRMPHSCTSL